MKAVTTVTEGFDVGKIRDRFPVLRQEVNGHPLVYLDSAATSQKPDVVIETEKRFYEQDNSNVHRGVHQLSERATAKYEAARQAAAELIHAPSTEEVVFVRGTTEAINLVAQSWGRSNLGPGDEVLITLMEHHSNIVPWQLVCEATGATLKVAPIHDDGSLDVEAFRALLSGNTKIAAFTHVSNALGTINPVKELTDAAHAVGAKVLIDGAQAAPHLAIDVQEIGCDFYCYSGHKAYGPTGIGVLWGRRELLDAMPPYQGGGEMIRVVSFEGTTYNDVPHKFEAGTPNIAGTVALKAAIDFLREVGLDNIAAHEHALLEYATKELQAIDGLTIIGTAPDKAGVVSFTIDGIHPHDIGSMLDQYGVAIRTGHHCAQPVMEHYGVPATSRISLAMYNNRDDIDRAVAALTNVVEVFA